MSNHRHFAPPPRPGSAVQPKAARRGAARVHAPPPVHFGGGAAQPKTAATPAARVHAAPPTQFGAGSAQAKPATAARGLHAPPPTAVGRSLPGGTVQARAIQGYFPAGTPRLPGCGAVQAKGVAQPRGTGNATALPASFTLPNGGQPLPEAVRHQMEAHFKADFKDVRIHVGPQAPALGALAFTVGNAIHFAPGQYQPDSVRGQQLLGHELTHVIQQRSGRVRNPFGNGLAVVQDPALEAEADRMGMRAAMSGPSPAVRPVATLQRSTCIQRMFSWRDGPFGPEPVTPPGGWEETEAWFNQMSEDHFIRQQQEEMQAQQGAMFLDEPPFDIDHEIEMEQQYQQELQNQENEHIAKQIEEEEEYYYNLWEDHSQLIEIENALKQPIAQNDGLLAEINKLIRGIDTAIRPNIRNNVIKLAQEIRSFRDCPTGKISSDTISWAHEFIAMLQRDGLNTTEISRELTTLESKTKSKNEQERGSAYAALQGYIFQIKGHLKSWKRYRLLEIENSTGLGLRRADELRIGKNGPVVVDYKAYKDSISSNNQDKFESQLAAYAKASHQWPPNTKLKYSFSGTMPTWVGLLFQKYAPNFSTTSIVKVNKKTLISNSKFIGEKQTTLNSFFQK